MKLGDKGGDVIAWQYVLRKIGFDTLPDGIFGPQTHTDTVEYQRELGVVADGIVGPATLAMHAARHPEAPYARVHTLPEQNINGQGPKGKNWLIYIGIGALAYFAFKG